MADLHPLAGIYAAAVTPLVSTDKLDLESIPVLMQFLAARGCHGALFFGTTGEGPSFSRKEREALMRSARAYRQQTPNFRLLAGTGTPSLGDSMELTKLAFDLGYDGVVVLPPYYFRKAGNDGLFAWFSELIQKSVPSDGYVLGYHFPGITGIGFSLNLLARLKDAFPNQFAGIKDSSHDETFAAELGNRFGRELLVLNGTDSLLHHALKHHAQGAITAPANIISEGLREIWDLHQKGEDPAEAQEQVSHYRHILEEYLPFAPSLKMLMHRLFHLPRWSVKPPLEELSAEAAERLLKAFEET